MSIRCAAMSLVCVLLATVPVRAEEDPGEWFSDEAVVVVRVRSPKVTLAKAVSFVNTVSPIYSTFLINPELGLSPLFNDRLLRAIDLEGDIWWAVVLDENDEGGHVIVLRARDEDALQQYFDEGKLGWTVRGHGQFAIIAQEQRWIDQIDAHIAGEDQTFYHAMSAEQRTVFDSGDYSLFINIQKIAAAGELNDSTTTSWVEMFDEEPLKLFLRRELAEIAADKLITAQGLVLGATIDKSKIELEAVLQYSDEETGAQETGQSLSDFQVLRRLPVGRQFYVAGMPPFPSPAGSFLNVFGFDSYDDETDQLAMEKQGEILRRLQKLKYGQWASGVSLPTLQERRMRLDAVTIVDQPDVHRLMNNTLALTQAEFVEFQQKRVYEFLEGGEQFGENVADVHRITFKSDDDDDPLRSLYGKDGLVSRCLYDDKLFINTVGGGKSDMLQALERQRMPDPPPLSAGLAAARAKLPQQASFVCFVDIAALYSSVVTAEMLTAPTPVEFTKIVQAGIELSDHTQTYCAAGLALHPQHARLKVYLPADQSAILVNNMGILPALMFMGF